MAAKKEVRFPATSKDASPLCPKQAVLSQPVDFTLSLAAARRNMSRRQLFSFAPDSRTKTRQSGREKWLLDNWYIGTYITDMTKTTQRVQTGVRLEKRLLKVLKGLAEHLDMSLGDLIEGMALHSFEGKAPFSAETRRKIDQLKDVYDLGWTAKDSHKFGEGRDDERSHV